MKEKKKTPIGIIVQWIMGIIGFIGMFGFIITASTEWGEFKANQKEVTFPDSETKHKVIRHTNEVPNAVDNYKAMQTNESLAVRLDTAYAWVNARFKEDIAKSKIDSINNAHAVKSRAKRDSINVKNRTDIENIQREQIIQTNTDQLILQELKNLKELINTNQDE